ncbi:MAG: T9SS type A sorting domain-containing protein [Bacteroidetes bacterium]|nr:T9SS type A sorting domain-containing protein [Bacteroidota bacterium]
MKKFFPLFFFIAFTQLFAQKTIRHADGSYFKQCSHFEITKPLWQLAKENPAAEKTGAHGEAADRKRKFARVFSPPSVTTSADPVVQKTEGNVSTHGAIENFDGTYSADGWYPLDPTGMAGPNHFVQCVNSNYQVFGKTGVPVTAIIDLATLFPNSTDDGDPIVMYDKFADRWFISEFQSVPPVSGNEVQMLIAVSATNDPAGSYYLYTFEPDSADYIDYPKFSIWADGYYETCNCDFQKVTVYDRTKMLAGDTTAGFIVIPSVNPNPNGFWCPQTLFADGQLPPYGSPEYLFYYTDDNWGAPYQDMIYIYKVTANWSTKTGTLAADDSLATQPFNSYFTGGTLQDIAQPGTTIKLDALDGFFAYRIPYVRWSTYNSAVMSYPVNTGNKVAGIRWYELRQDSATNKWSIAQQSTYAPADTVSRWNAGIGMDMNGNIGLAFNVASAKSVFPGIRYTGRNACDSLGTMTLAESTPVTGSSNWTDNRWGDYSHISLDPTDGITFWHTNQYIGTAHSLNTRIFSFQIPLCSSGVPSLSSAPAELHAFQSGNMLYIKATGLTSEKNFEVGLYTLEGKLISRQLVSPVAGTLETAMNIFGFARGIYLVRIISDNFQRTVKVSVE